MDAYLICATPRTGSSLLCGLLESTGVAGRPESYFRAPDEREWAARWGITDDAGAYDYVDFVRSALAAGRTGNGVFAARIMWGTMGALVGKLRPIVGAPTASDIGVLRGAFGPTSFVYLRRHDVLAQAVSWSRAEQTDIWFERTGSRPEAPARQPRFDRDNIHDLCQMINEHNDAWEKWFASVGVEPHRVHYEDLDRDPAGTARVILGYLGVELPPGTTIERRHRRLADDLNTQWIERYRAIS